MTTIDTGDTVHHKPSGEDWIVAYVKDDRLFWCGYPYGEAKLSDCVLLEKATDEKRDSLLRDLANGQGTDPRRIYARERLGDVA